MQMTTMGPQAPMPVCLQEPLADGSWELSTVHEPVDALSFYAEICQLALAGRREWRSRTALAVANQTFPTHVIPLEPGEGRAAHSVASRATEIVSLAKRVTGLSIKDLAPVFGVTRQTLYNFRKAQERISDRNWQRLEAVDREMKGLAEILPSSPGSLAKHCVFEGETLHGLLCAPSLDTPRIQRLARALAAQLNLARQADVRHATSIDQLTRHG